MELRRAAEGPALVANSMAHCALGLSYVQEGWGPWGNRGGAGLRGRVPSPKGKAGRSEPCPGLWAGSVGTYPGGYSDLGRETCTGQGPLRTSTHQSSSTTRTSTKNVFLLTRFLNVSAKGENFSYVGHRLKK